MENVACGVEEGDERVPLKSKVITCPNASLIRLEECLGDMLSFNLIETCGFQLETPVCRAMVTVAEPKAGLGYRRRAMSRPAVSLAHPNWIKAHAHKESSNPRQPFQNNAKEYGNPKGIWSLRQWIEIPEVESQKHGK